VEILLAKETAVSDIAAGKGEGNSIHLATTSASDFSRKRKWCWFGNFLRAENVKKQKSLVKQIEGSDRAVVTRAGNSTMLATLSTSTSAWRKPTPLCKKME